MTLTPGKKHYIDNPFDVEEVVKELAKNKKPGGHPELRQEYNGMHLKTLAKRLDVYYSKSEEWDIAKDLRRHKNIEYGDRTPVKYVSDEELERREEEKKAIAKAKEKKESTEARHWEELQELVASHEDLQETQDDYTQRSSWYRTEYKEEYSVIFEVQGMQVKMDISPRLGTENYRVHQSAQTVIVENIESVLPTLEAVDTFTKALGKVEAVIPWR